MPSSPQPIVIPAVLPANWFLRIGLAAAAAVLAMLVALGQCGVLIPTLSSTLHPVGLLCHLAFLGLAVGLFGEYQTVRSRQREESWREDAEKQCRESLGLRSCQADVAQVLGQAHGHWSREIDLHWLCCYVGPAWLLPLCGLLAGVRTLQVSVQPPQYISDIFRPLLLGTLEMAVLLGTAAWLRENWRVRLGEWVATMRPGSEAAVRTAPPGSVPVSQTSGSDGSSEPKGGAAPVAGTTQAGPLDGILFSQAAAPGAPQENPPTNREEAGDGDYYQQFQERYKA